MSKSKTELVSINIEIADFLEFCNQESIANLIEAIVKDEVAKKVKRHPTYKAHIAAQVEAAVKKL